jgi:hypothetical protein
MTNHKNPDYPQSMPDYVPHPHYKPKPHKPDLIRLVGYTLNTQGKLVKDLTAVGKEKFKSYNANTPPMATSKQLSITSITTSTRSD